MEINGSVFNNRRSSSDLFLGLFQQPESDCNGVELEEGEVFWSGDYYESNNNSNYPFNFQLESSNNRCWKNFQPEKFGILAAISEEKRTLAHQVLCRKKELGSSFSGSVSSSIMIPSIPRPQSNLSDEYSTPSRKFHQSAPVNVPVLPKAAAIKRTDLKVFYEGEEETEDAILPPHEIVAKGSARSPMTTFSVLEGEGRTLKGRDLRRVRNAVWRKTGFLD